MSRRRSRPDAPARRQTPSLPVWVVTVEPHAVSPRWSVHEQTVEVEAASGYEARQTAIREALTVAGVPTLSWDLVHRSLGFTRAVEAGR
jgi:hypothetical protein